MSNINKESIQKTLSILNRYGVDKINIRSIGGGKTTNTIFPMNESENILKHIESINSEANIYITFNYCKCQSKYVKKIQNKNVHFIHLPFGKNL